MRRDVKQSQGKEQVKLVTFTMVIKETVKLFGKARSYDYTPIITTNFCSFSIKWVHLHGSVMFQRKGKVVENAP